MNPNLIDRKSDYPDLVKLTDLLDKTIDFGTQIFDWEVEENKIYKENIVCQTFFKNILEIGDGISILIQQSSAENAKILLRSLVENIFYIEYLLEKNYENRAKAYLVATFHIEINLAAKLDKSIEDFRNKVLKDKHYNHIQFLEPMIPANYVKDFDERLKQPIFIEAELEYQRTARVMKKATPPWYALYNGPRNLDQLANHVRMNAQYELLYRFLSESVHSTNVIKNSLAEFENGPGLGRMRNPENADMLVSLTLLYLELVYSSFIEKRIPVKAADYEVWHQEFSKEFEKLFK